MSEKPSSSSRVVNSSKHPLSNLILFGYKSSGKTYFGKRLAQQLNRPFLDTDLLIEKKYQEKHGEKWTCRQIVSLWGEKAFRLLESEAIDSLQEVQGVVIALGGGAVLNPQTRFRLKGLGTLIYLDVDKEVIKERMMAGDLPAFLDREDPQASFEKMYEERQPIYNELSTLKIVVNGKSDQEILDELKALAEIQ